MVFLYAKVSVAFLPLKTKNIINDNNGIIYIVFLREITKFMIVCQSLN